MRLRSERWLVRGGEIIGEGEEVVGERWLARVDR